MGIINRLSQWSLNYQVSAFGAYATILVQSVYLILRGFEQSSLLSISVLTNASAVLLAGFGPASSTPLAVLQICLTSFFLLWATFLQGNDHFDGTYAVLCSVAQFTYQLLLRHYGNHSEVLPQHEKCIKAEEAPSESRLPPPPIDCKDDAANFSGSLRIFFGDAFCLEGAIVPVVILGTVMTYRVLDFDLGFGLVFAFMSAFLSSIVLLFINSARMRGRRVDTQKSIRILICLLFFVGAFCFWLLSTMEVTDPELSWWKIAYGVAWFIYLFWTAYIACRFLTHATFFPCAACSQRKEGILGPLTQDASAACIWDDYITLPASDPNHHPASEVSATFRIKRLKGPDLVERFWLNDQEWFQISPRSFVIFFVACIALASFSGGALNPEGSFANIVSHISKIALFYVTMAFTSASTGHVAAESSPELMFVPLRHSFPEWNTIAKAIIATMLVHTYIVFVAPMDPFITFITPLACIIMAPLLVTGISKPLDLGRQQGSTETGTKAKTVRVSSDEVVSSSAKTWTIGSTLVYSSSRIRCFDIRVLLLGLSIALFEVLCTDYQDEMSYIGLPTSAIVVMYVTAVWLCLENMLPKSQNLKPRLLSLVVAALVGNHTPVNFPSASGQYDNKGGNEKSTHAEPIPEIASRSNPILLAFWYSTLVSMVVVNHKLNNQKKDEAFPPTDRRPGIKDHLLFSFRVKASKINLAWKLRNSYVAVFLRLAFLASCLGESWPLEGHTTAASLLLFALIVGFQISPGNDPSDEGRSLPHIAAFGFATLMTILAVGLNRHGLLRDFVSDPKSDWKAGTWSAMVHYHFVVVWHEFLTRRRHVEVPLTEDLQEQ